LTSLKSHLPAALDDLIMRMLEKDANSRPTTSEVAQALQEIEKYGSSNTLPIRISADKPKAKREEEGFWVAVLPFKVRDGDPAVAVLADGYRGDRDRPFTVSISIGRHEHLRGTPEGRD